MFYSPLRYPGGKNKLAKFVASICIENKIDGHYIEPYAGGASVALYLLMSGQVKKITINDLDRAIYAFWYSVIYNTDKLCKKINNTEINIESWRKEKKIYSNKQNEKDLLKLGFATLFLNRANYSGIIDGGMMGGVEQKGEYKINCRFNKKDIINRIKNIAKYKDDINLENLDALDLIKKIKKNKKTIFYFDPPYFLKGQSLYMNSYNPNDHEKVSMEIKNIKNSHWIVSYDDTKEIQSLYKDIKKINYSFSHTAYKAKTGKETIFISPITKVDLKLNPLKYK